MLCKSRLTLFKSLQLLAVGLIISWTSTGEVIAQTRNIGGSAGFKGLSADQVQATFGKPDEILTPRPSEEVFKYGEAMFFLTDGKVVGVVGDSELLVRQRLRENVTTDSQQPRRDDLRGQWKTPWGGP